MKIKKHILYIFSIVILLLAISGCSKKNDQGEAADPMPSSTPTTTPAISNNPTPQDPSSVEPSPTEIQESNDPDSKENEYFEYRNNSYLVWLPIFNAGTFEGGAYDGTYDFASFKSVTKEDVKAYIEELKKAGFTSDISETDENDKLTFSGFNNDSWNAKVTYDGVTLMIGSGFKEESEDDKTAQFYSSTMLQYVPKFEAGVYERGEVLDDSSMYAFILYNSVEKSAFTEYVEKLKEAGYVYVIDEDSNENYARFIAMNDDRFECSVEYEDGIIKIGCGIADED